MDGVGVVELDDELVPLAAAVPPELLVALLLVLDVVVEVVLALVPI